ncbi:MAG: TetR/AcrR family transcriptional regulator, partial [Pseudomonadota bacterium]
MPVSQKKRTRRSPEAAREDILDSAEALLLEVGPQGLKLVDVAKRAGIGHSLIIHHFGGVAKVQSELAVRMCRRLMDEIATMMESIDFSGDVAPKIIGKVFDIFGRPENAKLIAWLVLSNQTNQQNELADQSLELGALLAEQLKKGGRGHMATPELVY